MSYEKEVAELWKEWKKSIDKYEKAIEDGYDVDADMWANDVETIHRQIHLYEQADKADEYEAKAKAFDEIKECLHSAQSSIDRSENRKEERDYAVAFFNELVEMDILEVYERTERND